MHFFTRLVPLMPAMSRHGREAVKRLAVAFTVGVLATSAWAQEDSPPATAAGDGLQNLLPTEAPEDLLTTLKTLPEPWSAWADSVTNELTRLYSEDMKGTASQRVSLQRLKVKVNTTQTALADYRYGSIRDQLISLRGALGRRVAVLEAALDTLAGIPAPAQQALLQDAKTNLISAADGANYYLDTVTGGENWKRYLQTIDVRNRLTTDSNSASLLTALAPILAKARTAIKSTDPQVKAFASGPALKTYLRALDRTVAGLTRQVQGVNNEQIREQLKALFHGLEEYEANGTTAAATEARTAYDALRDLAPDEGDRLTAALRVYYFNSNLHFTVTESFLNRIAARTRVEQGGVRDFILGADVYGGQTTTTDLSFDLLPSEMGGHVRINLMGTSMTSTEGHKSSVVIYSEGNHQFTAFKDVHFDGNNFQTLPAGIHVNPSNVPVAASTKLDGIPLLGGIARGVALRAANRKQPEAEAIAAQRLTSRVTPQFDSQVDTQFMELNDKLNSKLAAPLKAKNLYPDYKASRSTDVEFNFNNRLMGPNELGGGAPQLEPTLDGKLVLQIHESLINNSLDRLDIAGKTLSEEELRVIIENQLGELMNRKVSLTDPKRLAKPMEDTPAFIFMDKDPLRVEIADGNINLIFRAGFQRSEEKGGNIPPQIITVPLRIKIDGDETVLTSGDVTVDPVEPPANIAEQIARAGVIKLRVGTSIPKTRNTRTLKIERKDVEPISITVTRIDALDGWLGFHLQ